jgi:phage replication O-like protein O
VAAEVYRIESGDRVKVDKDNGFSQVSNELLEAISCYDFNGRELRILMLIIRGTYGFDGNAMMEFSRKKLAATSGLRGENVTRTKKSLVERNILIESSGCIGLNPYISDWLESGKRVKSDTATNNKTSQKRHGSESETTRKRVRNDTETSQERHKTLLPTTTLNKEINIEC